MGDSHTVSGVIRRLASEFRVLTLGGVAVISHGLDRNTQDADIWIEPFDSADIWAGKMCPHIFFHPRIHPVSIGTWESISGEDFATVVLRDGVLRLNGLDRPLDIFRTPNELDIGEFDSVWARAIPLDDGTRIPDVIDLLVTKQSTGREKDLMDIAFLEAKAEREYLEKLPSANAAQGMAMLERFLTPQVAEAALRHPAEAIRALGLRFLRELAQDGDPFAQDILNRLGG